MPVSDPLRILGLDPGSRVTGWGIVEVRGQRFVHIASGCIEAGDAAFIPRLGFIHAGLRAVVEAHAPGEVAVERVFVQRNVESALKLGQARGAALAAVLAEARPVHEYAATEVKLAVVGVGRADKRQVQHMVQRILGLAAPPRPDAADALAVALCRAFRRGSPLAALADAARVRA